MIKNRQVNIDYKSIYYILVFRIYLVVQLKLFRLIMEIYNQVNFILDSYQQNISFTIQKHAVHKFDGMYFKLSTFKNIYMY